jgi:hypothetical protein
MNGLFEDIQPKPEKPIAKPIWPCYNERQNVLFTGMLCLPGQQCLFDTDGASEPCTAQASGVITANARNY